VNGHIISGCSRSLAVVAEPGRQAATYTYRKEQAIRIVILKTGMLSQALSLIPFLKTQTLNHEGRAFKA